MAINLNIKPGPAVSRADFLATHPPYSIALDGYVSGEPWLAITPNGPYRNFNHHEVVDRSCTNATCEQARRGVVLGLYDLFCDGDGRRAELWVNDCDQDVCLATWILMNPDRAAEPRVRQLAQIEDLLDATAGAYPMPHEHNLLCKVRWVFEPYDHVRPHLTGMSGEQMRGVIFEVHGRIEQFAVGRAEQVRTEGKYRRLGGSDWWLVEVDRPAARARMVAAGVKAAVELYGRHGDRYAYALWRRSEYIVWFPVRDILSALNVAEGLAPDDPAGWGGGDNVGGGPRGRGSRLTPEEVERVVEAVVAEARPKS